MASPRHSAMYDFFCCGHRSVVAGRPVGFCYTCGISAGGDGALSALCDVCFGMHAAGRIPGHDYIPADASTSVLFRFGKATPCYTRCRRHTHREVELRCRDCPGSPLICHLCSQHAHVGHLVVPLPDEASSERRRIETVLGTDALGLPPPAAGSAPPVHPPFVTAASTRAAAVTAETLAVRAALDSARTRADAVLEAGVAALLARHAAWTAEIDAAGAARLAQLSGQQAAADAAAADAAGVAADARRALLVLRDADVVTHAPAIVARVQGAQARVATLGPAVVPGSPVSVALPELVADEAPLLAAIACLGALGSADFALMVDEPPPSPSAPLLLSPRPGAAAGGYSPSGFASGRQLPPPSSPSSLALFASSPRAAAAAAATAGALSGTPPTGGFAAALPLSTGRGGSPLQSPRVLVRLVDDDGGTGGGVQKLLVSPRLPTVIPEPAVPASEPEPVSRAVTPSHVEVPPIDLSRVQGAASPRKQASSPSPALVIAAAAAQQQLASPPLRAPVPAPPEGLLRFEGVVSGATCTPAISAAGDVYVPQEGSNVVHVFASNGAPRAALPVSPLGLSTNVVAAAFDDATGTLLLADSAGAASRVVAVDMASGAVQWVSSASSFQGCWDAKVLPAQGFVLVSSPPTHKIHVLRLADGVRQPSVLAQSPTALAVEPASGSLFASTRSQGAYVVLSWRWDAAGRAFVPQGIVKAAGRTIHGHRLAVVSSAASAGGVPYLVVAEAGTPTLRIIALPSRQLVHTHTVHGAEVNGLAAGPAGQQLAVCDFASGALTVLPWPLPPSQWRP